MTALQYKRQSEWAETVEAKRHKSLVQEYSGKENAATDLSLARSKAHSSVRGQKLSLFIDNVWKVSSILQLLRYCLDSFPNVGDVVQKLQHEIHESKASVTRDFASFVADDNNYLSSDEVLAADIVLGAQPIHTEPALLSTLHTSLFSCCESLVFQHIYGDRSNSCPAAKDSVSYIELVRRRMFDGTFWQATELRYTLIGLVGRLVNTGNGLPVLVHSMKWSEKYLYKRAEAILMTQGLCTLIESSPSVWLVARLDEVNKLLKVSVQADKDEVFDLFKHVASWVKHNCEDSDSSNETMELLLEHFDLPRMSMQQLQYLLDEEPLVRHSSVCIKKLASAYMENCMKCTYL